MQRSVKFFHKNMKKGGKIGSRIKRPKQKKVESILLQNKRHNHRSSDGGLLFLFYFFYLSLLSMDKRKSIKTVKKQDFNQHKKA